ncbi:MAG: MAPEG family protein, partial [Myxococcota bacterium]
MPVPITALYLALFAVFSGLLAFPAGRLRGSTGISIGDGGNPDLLLAMRRHANFVEFVPLLLVMFAALELNGASAAVLHGLGVALIVARVCHAVGLDKDSMASPLRGIGAGGTLLI